MRLALIAVVFVADPLMGALGFLMFRYPETLAKINARLSRKELRKFDSLEQRASTRRLGTLMMILAAFSLLSLLAIFGMTPRLRTPH